MSAKIRPVTPLLPVYIAMADHCMHLTLWVPPPDRLLLCRLCEELVARLPFSDALFVELACVLTDRASFSWLSRELVVDDLPLKVLQHYVCMLQSRSLSAGL